MRKASKVGNINRKTGHLPTYEHHEMAQRERKIFNSQPTTKKDGNNKDEDGGVLRKDFQHAQSHIHRLNTYIKEIKIQQQHERNRLSIYKSLNESSHRRMVSQSLL